MKRFAAFLFLGLLTAFALSGAGCDKIKIPGNVAGQVFNDGGQPQGFVSVQLIDPANGAILQSELSNESGNFMFKQVDPGSYILKVMGMGNKELPSDAKEFKLAPGKTATVNVTLLAAAGQTEGAQL
jgi:hypothetical protein